MRKIHKIINIALIFMLIISVMGLEMAHAGGGVCLRVPMGIDRKREKDGIDAISTQKVKSPSDVKVEFESILKEMPQDIPIMEGVEKIRRNNRFGEIIKYLEKFKNLNKLFDYESNMLPLFVETHKSAEDLDISAAEILSDKELMPIFDAIPLHAVQTRHLLARAILASDDAYKSVKTFIRKPDSKEVFSRVWGEFIAAYLASRKTREAAMTLLNAVSPGDFKWNGRMKYLAPSFGEYYDNRSDTYYGLLTVIWFYLTPVYEKLRGRGYAFEEAGEALVYLCEHFLDRGFGVPPYNYSYELWLREDEKAIKKYTRSGVSRESETEEFKTMMDIIRTSPKGIPPAASFVDKANDESLKMRDLCRSMYDKIESLGKKFIGRDEKSPYYRLSQAYSYLAEFPLCQLYERLLRYAWSSRPWECETQDDASAFLFKLHYYTPFLSKWADSNNEESLIKMLAKADVEVTEDERAGLMGVLQNIRKGIDELKTIAMEMPPPAYEEDVNVNHVIAEILKEGSYQQLQSDFSSSLPLVKGKRILLKKALTAILRRMNPLEYLWDGITIKTSISSGKVHIVVSDVPIDQDLEVIKIMLDPARLYSLEDRLHVFPDGGNFSEAAAIIKTHGGEINAERGAGKSVTFTITLPLALGQVEEEMIAQLNKKGVKNVRKLEHPPSRGYWFVGDAPVKGLVEDNWMITHLIKTEDRDAIKYSKRSTPFPTIGLRYSADSGKFIINGGYHRVAAANIKGDKFISAKIEYGTESSLQALCGLEPLRNGRALKKQEIVEALGGFPVHIIERDLAFLISAGVMEKEGTGEDIRYKLLQGILDDKNLLNEILLKGILKIEDIRLEERMPKKLTSNQAIQLVRQEANVFLQNMSPIMANVREMIKSLRPEEKLSKDTRDALETLDKEVMKAKSLMKVGISNVFLLNKMYLLFVHYISNDFGGIAMIARDVVDKDDLTKEHIKNMEEYLLTMETVIAGFLLLSDDRMEEVLQNRGRGDIYHYPIGMFSSKEEIIRLQEALSSSPYQTLSEKLSHITLPTDL